MIGKRKIYAQPETRTAIIKSFRVNSFASNRWQLDLVTVVAPRAVLIARTKSSAVMRNDV